MIIHKVFSALGTINTISLNCDETYYSKAVCLLNAAESYVLDMDRRLSVFSEDSEINNINKNAGKASVKVSADTLEILKQAENYKKLTHGAFDICAKTRGKVKIYESRSEVKLTTHNREADLGGIAKGYAIDTLLKLFENSKHCKIIINLGGTVVSLGAQHDIEIRNPFTEVHKITCLNSQDEIFVTSGIYEQANHIINPVKKKSVDNELMSVTLLGKCGAMLDSLATACMVIGLKKSIKMLKKLNISGVFILKSGEIIATDSLKNRLKVG